MFRFCIYVLDKDLLTLYLRHVMSWCLVKYKSNYNIILSYLLLFSLLIVCGDIELNPGPQGTPVSRKKYNIKVFNYIYNII
jgi:hypothetical protein